MHQPGFPNMPMHVPGITDAFFPLCLFRGESKCITSTWKSSSCPLKQRRISVWVWSHCCLQAAACSWSGLTDNFCSCLLAWSQSKQKSCPEAHSDPVPEPQAAAGVPICSQQWHISPDGAYQPHAKTAAWGDAWRLVCLQNPLGRKKWLLHTLKKWHEKAPSRADASKRTE